VTTAKSSSTRKSKSGGLRADPGSTVAVRQYQPNTLGGRSPGIDVPLAQVIEVQKSVYFATAEAKNLERAAYSHNWGDCLVDNALPDDPGPINSGTFKPVRRWLVLYRTAEAGVDGTVNLTVTDVRTALNGQGTTLDASFIIKQLHVWIAPNVASTHFSGVLYTKDDAENGILGGQYSDVAPIFDFVKFRVRFPGEGSVASAATAGTKQVIGLGGSAKWNGLIYAEVETYD